MKKYYIITSIVLFIGMLLTVVGFSMGGIQNVSFEDGRIVASRINVSEKTKKFANFKNLNIKSEEDDIKIVYGNEYSVRQVSNARNPLKMTLSRDTLSIDRKVSNDFNFNIFKDYESQERTIEVTIPRGQKLDNVQIDNFDNSIAINDDLLKTLKINSRDSDINLSNVNLLEGSKIENTDGMLTVRNSTFNNIQITSNDGQIGLHQVAIRGKKNFISNDDGSIDIYQLVDAGFIANADDEDSEITYEGHEYERTFKNDENNANLLNINSGDGEINIH